MRDDEIHFLGLRVTVDFAATKTLLAVKGDLDIASAPELAILLNAIVAIDCHSVVLDLAELGFIDASGLSAIASAARKLEPSRGKLILRAPSRMLQRLLDITGLGELVHLEFVRAAADPDRLGPEGDERCCASKRARDVDER